MKSLKNMISFSNLDIIIIISFFLILSLIGFFARINTKNDSTDFLLSGRRVGLFLFVMTNVSTWYGGILGVGEFTYNSGLLSWVTQGLPYYLFALLFAFFFAEKIQSSSLFTIPDKLELIYGKQVGLIASFFILILVTPAPYILMTGNLIQLIFNIDLLPSIIIATIFSSLYLLKGGYKADLFTDVFQFFVMFVGFIMIFVFSLIQFDGYSFLVNNLPENHLKLFGGASPFFILIWFLIASWTFADPGFHQRCNAAKDGKTAKYGILISIILWALFDFLTTSTGLFSKAALPNIENPVQAFPLYAELILSSGTKGIFYAALFATIISTTNSFLFISATTFGRDLVYKRSRKKNEEKIVIFTKYGLLVSSIISIAFAYFIKSVISIWYLVGSVFIPGLIFLIISSYYNKFQISNRLATLEIITASVVSLLWIIMKIVLNTELLPNIEPMIIGLFSAFIIHTYGLRKSFFFLPKKR
ncbi:MAG: sodium:solute symporter family protein [Ignavibacteria bacterium]|nr:sodium:solute symporter family protein [Ignavibacteria bacterium]